MMFLYCTVFSGRLKTCGGFSDGLCGLVYNSVFSPFTKDILS